MSDFNGFFSEGRQGLICRCPSDGGAWVVPARRTCLQPVADKEYRLRVTGSTSNGNLRFADLLEEADIWRARVRAKILKIGATQEEEGTVEVEGVTVRFTLLGPDWVEDGTMKYRRLKTTWQDDPLHRGLPAEEVFVRSNGKAVPLTQEQFGGQLFKLLLGHGVQYPDSFKETVEKLWRLEEQVARIDTANQAKRISWPRLGPVGYPVKRMWVRTCPYRGCKQSSEGFDSLRRWLVAEAIERGATTLRDVQCFEIPDLSWIVSMLDEEDRGLAEGEWKRLGEHAVRPSETVVADIRSQEWKVGERRSVSHADLPSLSPRVRDYTQWECERTKSGWTLQGWVISTCEEDCGQFRRMVFLISA